MKNNYIRWTIAYILIISVTILATQLGSRAVSVISENLPVDRESCIIIDAGHGGEDGGATSCTGKLESAYNLEIAQRLNDFMMLLGYETTMIRTSDVSVYTQGTTIAQKKISDLKERVHIVNSTPNGILVSIHQNFFPDQRYHGAQVFYNNVSGSDSLAKHLQDSLVVNLNPGSKRLSKRSDGIYLMDHIDKTGVLIECGFLSNVEENAKLIDPSYQKKLICVIGTSLSSYLSNT